jgi:hypothetical protein
MDPTNNNQEQPQYNIPDGMPPQPPQLTPQPAQPVGQQSMTNQQANTDHLKINPLAAMQDGEEMIADIHRHPFGIISLYFFAFIGLSAACGVILLLIPKLIPANSSYDPTSISVAAIVVVIILMLLGLGVTTMVYWQNRWVVTSDSLTQITQRSLFNRQVSQLSFGNLEDVTAEQRGIIPNLFNFGTLKAETAGEHSKFFFLYCPNPNLYARKI